MKELSDAALAYMRRQIDAGYMYGPENRRLISEANARSLAELPWAAS